MKQAKLFSINKDGSTGSVLCPVTQFKTKCNGVDCPKFLLLKEYCDYWCDRDGNEKCCEWCYYSKANKIKHGFCTL